MLTSPSQANTTDFINGSAVATTTGVVTIPANRYFSVDIQLSATHQGATTATPRVTYTTSGGALFSPPTGSVVSRLSVSGLATIAVQDSNVMEFSGYSGSDGATLDFNLGSATAASCIINGFLF